MARVLSVLSPSTSIPAARKLLAEQHLSGAPVVDSEGRLLGVVSQKDLLKDLPETGPSVARYHVLHDGKMLTETAIPGVEAGGGRIEEVMTREVLTITEETPLREAMRPPIRGSDRRSRPRGGSPGSRRRGASRPRRGRGLGSSWQNPGS